MQKNLGTIKWPVRLEDNAAEKHNYSNSAIRKVLEDTYGAVLEILLGERDHPIVNLYNTWIKNRPRSIKLILQHHFNFSRQFSPSILPGDDSLIEPFLLYLRHDVKDSKVLVESHWIDIVGNILFRLAILRTYLGRKPCDDDQIFYLAYTGGSPDNITPDDIFSEAKRGSIDRILTIPEKAVAASGSFRNMGVIPSLQRKIDTKNHLPDTKFVKALSPKGDTYKFFNTTAIGMIGHRQFIPNRRLEPISRFKAATDSKRPKPRFRGKQANQVIPDGVRLIQQSFTPDKSVKRPADTEPSSAPRRSKRLKIEQ